MSRLRYNNQSGTLGAALTAAGTMITFASAPNFATITSPDYIPIEIGGGTSAYELVYLTAYTAGATTGTITRAAEDSTNWPAAAHAASSGWAVAPTVQDFVPSTINVAPPTGVAATDMANLAAAAAAATPGGTVQLQTGGYATSSSLTASQTSHTVACSSGSTTWTYNGTAPTVGQYVVGVNVQGRIPQILTVTPGTGFTTDIAPNAPVSGTVYFVTPSLVLPEGVKLNGVGALKNVNGSGTYITQIKDSGSGYTVLIRGATSDTYASSFYGLSNVSLVNTGTAQFGLFVGNGAWYIESDFLDTYGYTVGGIGLDCNINSHDFRNTTVRTCGSVSSTGITGGLITHPFNPGSSASCNFYNPYFIGCAGWGVADGQGSGAYGVVLYSPQFNATVANANSTPGHTGSSAWLFNGGSGAGKSSIRGGWSETAAAFDLVMQGNGSVTDFSMFSSTAYAVYVVGATSTATLVDCTSAGHTTCTVQFSGGANVNWIGGDNSGDPYLWGGGPGTGSSAYGGISTSNSVFSAGAIYGAGRGISPGSSTGSTTNVLWSGSGAPGAGVGSNGDFWFRTDTPGTVNQRIYIKAAGAWTALSV